MSLILICFFCFLVASALFTFGYVICALLGRAVETMDRNDIWYRGYRQGIDVEREVTVSMLRSILESDGCSEMKARIEDVYNALAEVKELN